MDPKQILKDVNKIPVIGDIIIAFAIITVLTTFSSAGGFWGLEGQNKELLINIFVFTGAAYFFIALLVRTYFFIKKKRS